MMEMIMATIFLILLAAFFFAEDISDAAVKIIEAWRRK